MRHVRVYLRASTKEQNAERAKSKITDYLDTNYPWLSYSFYLENESGTKLERPVLNALINEAKPYDILLVESINRLTRLKRADWHTLKDRLKENKILVVSLDAETTLRHLSKDIQKSENEVYDAVLDGINSLFIDIIAISASQQLADIKEKQSQGIRAKQEKGEWPIRKPNYETYKRICSLTKSGYSIQKILEIVGQDNLSKSTIVRARKWGREKGILTKSTKAYQKDAQQRERTEES